MATILVVATGLTAAALIARASIKAIAQTKSPITTTLKWMPRNKSFLKGGFEQTMSRREAALILGIKESSTKDKIKDAHRKLMVANHPDRSGSPFIASKVNEAKDLLFK